MRNKIKWVGMAVICSAIWACAGEPNHQQKNTGKEFTSKYICPMHCENSGSDSMDVCPTCGMDYVLNNKNN